MNDTATLSLDAMDYAELADFLARSMRDEIVPTPGVTTKNSSGSQEIHLCWRRPGVPSLHLYIKTSEGGLHANLYEGDGQHTAGEGVRHSWDFFQRRPSHLELTSSGIAMTGERDNPFGSNDRYELRLEHPLVVGLPGYDRTAVSFLTAMSTVVQQHLSRLRYI